MSVVNIEIWCAVFVEKKRVTTANGKSRVIDQFPNLSWNSGAILLCTGIYSILTCIIHYCIHGDNMPCICKQRILRLSKFWVHFWGALHKLQMHHWVCSSNITKSGGHNVCDMVFAVSASVYYTTSKKSFQERNACFLLSQKKCVVYQRLYLE